MAVFEEVSGRFIAPDGSPLSGSVVFTPAFVFARDDEAVTLPAPVTVQLDKQGSVSASLQVPDESAQPTTWTWRACPRLRHAGGAVPLAEVLPVPTSTGEYVTRGSPALMGWGWLLSPPRAASWFSGSLMAPSRVSPCPKACRENPGLLANRGRSALWDLRDLLVSAANLAHPVLTARTGRPVLLDPKAQQVTQGQQAHPAPKATPAKTRSSRTPGGATSKQKSSLMQVSLLKPFSW